MNRLIKPISFLIVALTIASCSKNKGGVEVIDEEGTRPLVDYQIVNGDDPFSFEFKNMSTNFNTLEWRFGDDSVSNEDSPKHVYLATGTFEVNLKAISETGANARKLVKINILPDDVVGIRAVKTGNPNEIKFMAEPKKGLVIKSIEWSFTEVSPAVKSSELSPIRTYAAGSFNSFSVKVITSKGSVINFSKFVTPEGVAENITANAIFASSSNNSNTNENAVKILDGNVDTKVYLANVPLPLIFKFAYASPQTVKIYAIGNGNDSPDRDPKIWTLEGSNDETNWTIVDSQSLTTTLYFRAGNLYKKMHYFAVANPQPFSFYRWKITALWNGGSFQVSEFQLFR